MKAVAHFLAVTQSFWPGLFDCLAVPGLPATNNPKKLGWRGKIPFLLRQAQHERNFFGSPNG